MVNYDTFAPCVELRVMETLRKADAGREPSPEKDMALAVDY